MGITVRNHASGSVCGFARGLALLDDEDARVRLQAPRQRESNDAPADDDNVPGLHISIVVENFVTEDSRGSSGQVFGFKREEIDPIRGYYESWLSKQGKTCRG